MLKKFYLNLNFTKFVRKCYFMFYPNLFNLFNYKLRIHTNAILQFCTIHRIFSLFYHLQLFLKKSSDYILFTLGTECIFTSILLISYLRYKCMYITLRSFIKEVFIAFLYIFIYKQITNISFQIYSKQGDYTSILAFKFNFYISITVSCPRKNELHCRTCQKYYSQLL